MEKTVKLLFITICLLSCEPLSHKHAEGSLKFVNNSDNTLRFYESYLYPDTVIPQIKPDLYYVGPKISEFIYLDETVEKVFEDLPQDILSIYVFDEDTVNTYEWVQIKEGYKILIRYDLSLEDLEQMNWTIIYP